MTYIPSAEREGLLRLRVMVSAARKGQTLVELRHRNINQEGLPRRKRQDLLLMTASPAELFLAVISALRSQT